MKFLKRIKALLALFFFDFYKNRKKNDYSLSKEAFFIIGSGRNGSTLLAMLLNRHPNLFLPPEQFALPYTLANWYLPGYNFWPIYYKYSLSLYLSKNQSWKLTSNDKKFLLQKIKILPKEKRNPVSIYTIIFKHYATSIAKKNITLIGDHSPITTVFYPYVFHHFPYSKYIFLLRHPFDVVVSHKKLKTANESTPQKVCEKWNNSINAYDFLISHNYNVILVKYEDLVNSPSDTTLKITDFLHVKNIDLIHNKDDATEKEALGVTHLNHHQNLFKPITNSSVGKWKKTLDKETIEKIKPLVQQNAQRFGYNLDL